MAITRTELTPLTTLSARFRRDVRLGRIRNGVPNPNTADGSEIAIRADAYAAPVLEIKAQELALQDATMPDKASGDDLLRLCSIYGVTVSAGAGAQGEAANGAGVFRDVFAGSAVAARDGGGEQPIAIVDRH